MPSNPPIDLAWPCGRAGTNYMPCNPPLDVAWPCGRARTNYMPCNPPLDVAWPCGRADIIVGWNNFHALQFSSESCMAMW